MSEANKSGEQHLSDRADRALDTVPALGAESAVEARRLDWENRLLELEEAQHIGRLQRSLRRMRRNRLLLLGSALGVVVLAAGILGPWITGGDYVTQDFQDIHLPPLSDGHIFGTDRARAATWRCRVFVGIRVSLTVAAGVTVLAHDSRNRAGHGGRLPAGLDRPLHRQGLSTSSGVSL